LVLCFETFCVIFVKRFKNNNFVYKISEQLFSDTKNAAISISYSDRFTVVVILKLYWNPSSVVNIKCQSVRAILCRLIDIPIGSIGPNVWLILLVSALSSVINDLLLCQWRHQYHGHPKMAILLHPQILVLHHIS
jgi:hypothetical protein